MTARAKPDGYTLMVGYVATHATNPAVKKNLGYDAVKDFTPIAMIGGTPNLLVVTRTVPVNTLQEFVVYAKANPGKVDYGTSGVGTLNHLVMEQFKRASGVPSMAVPYRSIGQAFTDAVFGDQNGNEAQDVLYGLSAAMRRYLWIDRDRLGVEGVSYGGQLSDWLITQTSVFKAAILPQAITRKLNEEINKALASPALRDTFAAEALTVMPMTPSQFGKYIVDEIAHWTAVAHDSNIEGE